MVRRASVVKDAIRRERARAPRGTSNDYVTQLAKDALTKGRSKCVEQVVAFVVELAQRGQLEGAVLIARELQFAARAEYERLHPARELTLAEAHIAEECAEGAAEEAETAFVHSPTRGNADRYLAASVVHVTARERLDDVVRRMREAIG